jgi:SAM-dependent methyltransferase
MSEINPFTTPDIAASYEAWFDTPQGRHADRLEKGLLARLLASFPAARTLLEIGSGSGHFSRWFCGSGLAVVGLEPAAAMLAEARRGGGEVAYLRGDGLALPFARRTFDLVALITSLEFMPDPEQALAETTRIARQGLILGVLNRWSLWAIRYRRSGGPVWSAARFSAPGELAALVRRAAGERLAEVAWRTALWPLPGLGELPLPFGAFIGMSVRLRQNSQEVR